MTPRGEPVEIVATLPDGREVVVHVGVPDDPYTPRRELSTVDVELHEAGRPLAAVRLAARPRRV